MASLSHEERSGISRTVVQGLLARLEGAMMAETFDSREDRHLSWIAMQLDEQGWREMATALAAVFGEVEQIRDDAERRSRSPAARRIPSTCAILGFESPQRPDRPRSACRLAP